MTLQQIYEKVATELGLPVSLVANTYKAYWKFNRSHLSTLPLNQELSEEEFNKLKTSINIPSLGKLCCTYDEYKRVKNRFKIAKQHVEHKENQTNVYLSGDNNGEVCR